MIIEENDTNSGAEGTDASPSDTSQNDQQDDPNAQSDDTFDLDPGEVTKPTNKDVGKTSAAVEDDEISPEDAKVIHSVVSKEVESIRGELQELKRERVKSEINEFLNENTEYKKYKPIITKFKQHPSWVNIPVEAIAHHVSAKDQQRLGAQKERDAQKKAVASQNTGNSSRDTSDGGKSWKTASSEEIEAEVARVLGHRD